MGPHRDGAGAMIVEVGLLFELERATDTGVRGRNVLNNSILNDAGAP